MKTNKSILWMGAAVLAAAFFAATMWTGRSEDARPGPTAEPDLFTFVKSPDSTPVAQTTTEDASQSRHAEPPGQAPAADTRLTPAQLVATEQAVREMRAQGAGEEAIYRLRATTLTAEAAAQLARIERDEAAWKARVDAYLAERSKIAAGDDGSDPLLVLQQLRDAHFTAEEQQRLNAYETPMTPRPVLQ